MNDISSVRLAVPETSSDEILRTELIRSILEQHNKITFIHAGAGFGKTTLLSQVAHQVEKAVWVTLDGENDVFTFLNLLSDAIFHTFSDFQFVPVEYLPFEDRSNFITLLANAFISRIEQYANAFTLILDDLHTISDRNVRTLIVTILKYKPDHIYICLSSREAPWQELVPLQVRGHIKEFTHRDLAFSKEEINQILGLCTDQVYQLTEGWPIAIGSFKILLLNGATLDELPYRNNDLLYSYLYYECVRYLPTELIDFLKQSSCFEELDFQMLDCVLEYKHTKQYLDSLVTKNLFTSRSLNGSYRYHALFRNYLRQATEPAQITKLQYHAAAYYFENKNYSKAAEYAILIKNYNLLSQIILNCYKEYLNNGTFHELRHWFSILEAEDFSLGKELLLAKGALLSSIGNFTEAKYCLDQVIPQLQPEDRGLYFEAMLHKARILRNFSSFEESNRLLDQLIPELDELSPEFSYPIIIEKIYNLCWNSQIKEAFSYTTHMTELCASAGNLKVKAWYERYLSVIYFVMGKMKEAVFYYEKALELPPVQQVFLSSHSINIFVAKAYQMLGDREKAIVLIETELNRLRSNGRFEELWLGYLFAAEIHYQNTFIDQMNGLHASFEITRKYFILAEEYASLYRKTDFQMKWTRMQKIIYSLMFTSEAKENLLHDIFDHLDQIYDYFKTIALARLYSYFGAISDFQNAVKYAKLSIELGERANMMLMATMAYGILVRVSILKKDQEQAIILTGRFLRLCSDNGVYEYFRMRKAYDPILEFALIHGIEPEITRRMMEFAGYSPKKVYIETFGGLSVYPFGNRTQAIKMRSKKERELLAYIITAGVSGVTKEQIYEALFYESLSDNIKKLIGVNLAHLKNDLTCLGIDNPFRNNGKHYSICMDEIELDIGQFEEAMKEFKRNPDKSAAHKILSLYKGEYLSDYEAFWATGKKISYREAYEKALEFLRKELV
jgi:ATP-dependent transcriptional regulator